MSILIGISSRLVSCSSAVAVEENNVAGLYQEEGLGIQPEIVIQHYKIDTSRAIFTLDRMDLLYTKIIDSDFFKASLLVRYELFSGYENMTLLDSGSILVADIKTLEDLGRIQSEIKFKRPKQFKDLLLRVHFVDLNRKNNLSLDLRVQQEDLNSRQFFELRDLNGSLKLRPWVQNDKPYLIKYFPKDTILAVRFYKRNFPIAIPPHATNDNKSFDFKEDSLYFVSTYDTLFFRKPGIYHFQVDSTSMQGFSVFNFYNDFPYINEPELMLPPIRYISTKKEFEAIQNAQSADSLKLLADAFWLGNSGAIERGQEAIAQYFTRVEKANEKFSSYLEGWKTDRGLIYIIYGPPSQVFRSDQGESWVYGNRNSQLNYVFNFLRVNNPFSSNDYELTRFGEYRYGWGQAIAAWRSGKAYGIKDIKREQDARDAQSRQQRASPYFWY